MAVDLSAFCIGPAASVREVIELIERNNRGVALVVDPGGRLLHTVTDGDLRRAFHKALALDASIVEALVKVKPEAHRTPVTASAGTARETLAELFAAHSVRHIPLVDESGRVVDLAFRSDMPGGSESVQAVIMAGGRGMRMRPLTNEMPKPMLQVGGRPLLEYLVQQVRDYGIRKVNITTNYKPEKIRQHFGDGAAFGLDVDYVSEHEPLGTAGALRLLRERHETLLVINGDILTNINFRAMLDHHHDQRAGLTVGVTTHDVEIPFGVVETDGERVSGIAEKPVYRYFVNAGIYVLGPEILDVIPERSRIDMTEVVGLLLARGVRVVPFVIMEYWRDVGRLEDYETAEKDLISGRFKQ
jgi:dTDP-glucose pyrophosphorylase/CBS domain-containing protein